MQPAQVMIVSQVSIPCPRCGQIGANIRTWSWWGGLLGPKILKQATCMFCNQDFNHQTGKPITGQTVALYVLVPFAIIFGLFMFVGFLSALS